MTRPSKKSKPRTKSDVAALDMQIGNQLCVKRPSSPSNGTGLPSARLKPSAFGCMCVMGSSRDITCSEIVVIAFGANVSAFPQCDYPSHREIGRASCRERVCQYG